MEVFWAEVQLRCILSFESRALIHPSGKSQASGTRAVGVGVWGFEVRRVRREGSQAGWTKA